MAMNLPTRLKMLDSLYDKVEISAGPDWDKSICLTGHLDTHVVVYDAGNLEDAVDKLLETGVLIWTDPAYYGAQDAGTEK